MNKELKTQLKAVIAGEVTDIGRVRGIIREANTTCEWIWKEWTRLTDLKEQALSVLINGVPAPNLDE